MKQINTRPSFSKAVLIIPMMILFLIVNLASGELNYHHPDNAGKKKKKKDSVESVNAFMQVYKVLMSPRCMNCHPSGDIPLQGDDSHIHTMEPKRGTDGKGLYAMKCMNCHQSANVPGAHTPPGNPNWHMPPADMKMIFEGRTPRQLARQLVDPNQNGHKDTKALLEHAHDGLVLAAWDPGEGRSLPPMSHEDFAKAWNRWINLGAFAPPADAK